MQPHYLKAIIYLLLKYCYLNVSLKQSCIETINMTYAYKYFDGLVYIVLFNISGVCAKGLVGINNDFFTLWTMLFKTVHILGWLVLVLIGFYWVINTSN